VDRTPYAKCHLQETIEEWDRFWNYSLILKALDHTYERVGVTTAESFKMYVLENRPVNEVATKLGIKPNAVYQHRNRVLKRAQEHLKFIKTEIGE
jgi:DNA-directed RNA polymerase specialized sigma24 family protein